jgi:copper homeostasis protein
MIVEIAANNINSAFAAWQGGANRIELVSNLAEGGTTPSFGTLQYCIQHIPIDTYPILRPRGGDFLYNQAEVDGMIADIQLFASNGCKGIVIGALTIDGNIDMAICKQLITAAGNMQITFHRAFDRAKNATEALQQIIDLGCHRLLTSGQLPNAYEGRFAIAKLQDQANGQIIIMPGAGVTATNAKEIIATTHATEIHASMKSNNISNMHYISSHFSADSYIATNEALVKELMEAVL